MNILLVAPEYPPHVIGGGGAVYEKIANYLAEQGHYVKVIFGDFRNKNFFAPLPRQSRSTDQLDAVPVPLIPTPKRFPWMLSTLPPTPFALLWLTQVISTKKWDVAHLHGIGFPIVDFAATLLRRNRIPYLFTVHGIPTTPFQRGPIAAFAIKNYLNMISMRTAKNAAKISVVSKSLLCNSIFPIKNGTVIYNGIDSLSEIRRDTGGFEGSKLRLFSISRLSYNKGIDTAINAIARLHRQGVSVTYDIYGSDGGEQSKLRQLCSSLNSSGVVHFRGRFNPAQRNEIFEKYDALIVPSRVEAFGLAALEALAAGVPVIATKVDGLNEFLTDDDSIRFEANDVEGLTNAIFLMRDPLLRQNLRVKGLDKARKFLWGPILEQYESLLKGITLN